MQYYSGGAVKHDRGSDGIRADQAGGDRLPDALPRRRPVRLRGGAPGRHLALERLRRAGLPGRQRGGLPARWRHSTIRGCIVGRLHGSHDPPSRRPGHSSRGLGAAPARARRGLPDHRRRRQHRGPSAPDGDWRAQAPLLLTASPRAQAPARGPGRRRRAGIKVVVLSDAAERIAGTEWHEAEPAEGQVRLIADSVEVLTGDLAGGRRRAACIRGVSRWWSSSRTPCATRSG